MSVACVLYESVEAADAAGGGPGLAPIGAMWYAPWMLGDDGVEPIHYLAPKYFAANAHRPPLVVVCPDRTNFCVDSRTIKDGVMGPDGWDVTGDPPRITVNPSIDIKGGWHGWIKDGVIDP